MPRRSRCPWNHVANYRKSYRILTIGLCCKVPVDNLLIPRAKRPKVAVCGYRKVPVPQPFRTMIAVRPLTGVALCESTSPR